MANRLPSPGIRFSKLLRQADEKHPTVTFHSGGHQDPGFGSPKFFRAWRYDFSVQVTKRRMFQIENLADGDLQAMIKAKIEARKMKAILKEKDPREIILEFIQQLLNVNWDWKIFGIRFDVYDFIAPGTGTTLTPIYSPEEITLDKIPRLGRVMIFGGEEKARQAWELTMAARQTRAHI